MDISRTDIRHLNLGVGRTAIEAHDGGDKKTEEIEKRTEIDDNTITKRLGKYAWPLTSRIVLKSLQV